MNFVRITLFISVFSMLMAQMPIRPVHTYSIVARDSVTGDLGVAVQSHWFQVGNSVTWAEAGVGAVATQSFIEISYDPLALDLMRGGKTAPEALEALLKIDPQREVRQVAMVDARGNVAVYTGKNCIKYAGHEKGNSFSVQANLMEKATVWPAMAKAYRESRGDLLERLMTALEAAQAQGGDIRGKQSAAILIVPGTTQGQPWREKKVDLRVDDSPTPLKDLRRLVTIHRAYDHMNRGDAYLATDQVDKALEEYSTAYKIYPQNIEILYWTAATMAGAGQVQKALPLFREVFKKAPEWREVTKRLPASGLLPDDPDLLKMILGTDH